jgi:hypothetical protein
MRWLIHSLAALAITVPAAPAVAATVQLTSTSSAFPEYLALSYVAAAGEVNTVSVVSFGGDVTVTDPTAELQAGAGCVSQTPHQVVCPATQEQLVEAIAIDLGDGDDFVSLDDADYSSGVVQAGEGNDTVIGGGAFVEHIYGGGGNDDLRGGRD